VSVIGEIERRFREYMKKNPSMAIEVAKAESRRAFTAATIEGNLARILHGTAKLLPSTHLVSEFFTEHGIVHSNYNEAVSCETIAHTLGIKTTAPPRKIDLVSTWERIMKTYPLLDYVGYRYYKRVKPNELVQYFLAVDHYNGAQSAEETA
jgi:hypothetical protein